MDQNQNMVRGEISEAEDFFEKRQQRYELGRKMVYGIAIINVLLSVAANIFAFDLVVSPISIIIEIMLSIGLCVGVKCSRWIFIANAFCSFIRFFGVLYALYFENDTTVMAFFICVLMVAILRTVMGCFLIFNKNVVQFFDETY